MYNVQLSTAISLTKEVICHPEDLNQICQIVK